MSITIRPARETDLPQLEWDGEYTHYRLVFREMWEEMQQGRRLLLVATQAEVVVGQVFIQFYSSDPRYADGQQRAYLYSLRVRPPWQGHGVGTRLIQNAEAVLQSRGFRFAVIAAAKDNPGALRLYQRLGYQSFDEDPGVWYFTDVNGVEQHIVEPCWVLQKMLAVEVRD